MAKQPPKSLDEKLTTDELEAFYDQSSDRSIAIILSAIVENHLTTILKLLMRREKAIVEELFSPSGPLGPFGTKIRLAYMLRVIAEPTYKDLLITSKIRNEFAHDLSIKTLETPRIADRIKSMHVYSLLKNMAATYDKASENPNIVGRIVSSSLSSVRNSYRDCLRLMIHHLVDFENGIKDREAALDKPPN